MKRYLVPALITLVGIAGALFAASRFPAVEGLGTKVRLPVYHGALTWATLIAFGFLLLAALWYLFAKSEFTWRWNTAFRWTAVTLWVIGAIFGFIAAYNTWDLSASQSSALQVMSEDPRLVIQIVIMCLGLIILLLPLVFEGKRLRACADVIFVIGSWVLLAWAMNVGDALHPDSPIRNSPELKIKVMFYLIMTFHLVMVVGMSSLFVAAQKEKELKHG